MNTVDVSPGASVRWSMTSKNGMDPARIGRYIAGIVEKKKPAVVYVAGAQYKFLSLLCKLLPAAARGKIVGKIYG